MKKVGLYNALFICFKIILSSLLIYYIFCTSFSFITSFLTDFEKYRDIRGIQNYGSDCIGTFIRKDNNILIYRYIVEGKVYYKNIDNVDSPLVDNKVELLYDVLEPNLCILKSEGLKIDSFYKETFENLGYLYMKYFGLVFLFSVFWYILDVLKYKGRVKLIEGQK